MKDYAKKLDTAHSPSNDLHKIETLLGDQEDTSPLIIWEFVPIKISEFSYEKLRLKSEPP
jgi:hypothetical protein